ncbi:glycosyltransferase family 87 protein [Corynebacterium heidelbergense]|uniref:Arabinofuranosyl transferase n=1 Tax=Corynebacterium heidelbergense TaxID=2055947 RepID=A0A364V5D7_9CORY|nr:glycosyltransferase family 87 protein [Corynebacterium heidelbergense]RAV31855.1 arabinofuranosyl transferase [Corynebacterium heidelbergense]
MVRSSSRATKAPTQSPGAAKTTPQLSRRQASTVLALVMWPLAAMSFIHKVLLVPQNKHETDDFTTVWEALHRFRAGIPVYSENYNTVDPHYLYSPGGTLLLSPLTALPGPGLGRLFYIAVNGGAIVAALAVLTVMFGHRLRGGVWPTAIFALFGTEAVYNTLLFSNNNGILLLFLVGFIYLLLHRRDILAGILIGLAITIKPQFAPLLFLPLVRKQWAVFAGGLGVPVLFNLAAWPLMTQPQEYVTKLVPYLGQVRDYANSSIQGVGAYFGIPGPLILLLRVIAMLFVAAAVLLLLRYRERDELMWATTTSSILLAGVFLISNLGQMYYSMLLVPLLFTVTRSRSVMHNPVAWLGIYWCMSSDVWFSDRWEWPGRIVEFCRGTVGWALLIIAVGTTAAVWWVQDRRTAQRPAPSSDDERSSPTPTSTKEGDSTHDGLSQSHR